MLLDEVLSKYKEDKLAEVKLKGSRLMTEIVGLIQDREELTLKIESKKKELGSLRVDDVSEEVLSVLKDYLENNK